MKHHVDVRRFRIGLHGLALLRGWPIEDPAEAEHRIRQIASVLGSQPVVHDLADPGVEAAYDAWAETYDELPNALLDIEEPLARSLLDGLEGTVAVDAATGTGRMTGALHARGFEVVALDLSPAMLKQARRRGTGSHLAIADLRSLPLPSESVDVAVCCLALTHLEHLGPAVAELARVVRPGGALVVTDPHPLAVATGGQAYFTAADGSRQMARNHVHWPSEYDRSFRASGLRIDRLEEGFVDDAFLQGIAVPEIRVDAQALLGLPIVIAWRVRKPG